MSKSKREYISEGQEAQNQVLRAFNRPIDPQEVFAMARERSATETIDRLLGEKDGEDLRMEIQELEDQVSELETKVWELEAEAGELTREVESLRAQLAEREAA